ncbi:MULTISPECIES: Cif family virulence factor [Streptomyces]|uniref:hypothetical protein n=1 Tax=Streptomyces TaxID=1883 RepID=UPI00371A3C97
MSDNRANDTAAIAAVLESLYKAWDAGDADAFVADYTQDPAPTAPPARRFARAWQRGSPPS